MTKILNVALYGILAIPKSLITKYTLKSKFSILTYCAIEIKVVHKALI